ncbi:MAG: MiaB/RimO family radical SAM methylthiotransferase [Lachnospiraceae bacterium]
MKSVALHNLGCKVNAYEMDVMQQILREKGYVIVPFDEAADIYIVNTCTVTNIADRKSRQMLHQAKARNPKAVVVAVGCYVQTASKEFLQDAGVDLAIGNNKKGEVVSLLERFLKEREEGRELEALKGEGIIDINAGCAYEEMTLKHTAEHTRAYIKIQDGCNQFCTYCIIPFARGRVRSRRFEDIREELTGLAAAGYKEVVLTGIHISSYGIDFADGDWEEGRSRKLAAEDGQAYGGSPKLASLLERIHDIDGIERIRLGSLEPRIVTKAFADRLRLLPKICPHFHLSLQSGCDETLKRMNRHYTTGEYLQCVELLRSIYAAPAITTDIIVGFPGETDEEFAETYTFLEKLELFEMHVFKYSERKGTRAAGFQDKVSGSVRTERSNRLLHLKKQQSAAFRMAYIGQETEVLFEEAKEIDGKQYQIGHTGQYIRVAKCTKEKLSNCIIGGRIAGFLNDELMLME